MRQVPFYLIIGNGRVARHIQHYFSLLHLSYATWNRQQPISLLKQLVKSQITHVLLLIKDDAIELFIKDHLQKSNAILIHFSGSLVTEHAYGMHPLMAFSDDLYEFKDYKSIPFVVDHDALPFADLLPNLPNPFVYLDKAFKPKYHALCVLSGNFSCLLWQKLFHSFEHEFNIPSSLTHRYLQQQTKNLLTNPEKALTGPLTRGDLHTLKNNMNALTHDPFKDVYQSFIHCYEKISGDKS